MGFFDGIFDAVGDVFGGLVDTVKPVLGPIAGAVGSAFGGPVVGAALGGLGSMIGKSGSSSLPFMGSNDEYGDSSFGSFQIPGAISSAAGSMLPALAAGGLSYLGQNSANTANIQNIERQLGFQQESQTRAMDFNQRQNEALRNWSEFQNYKAMEFSREMSNTSWQRAVADMRRAGINPLLAVSKGGATTPSGTSGGGGAGSVGAQSGAAAVVQNAMSPAVTSALAGARMLAEIDQIRAQTSLVKQQEAVQAVMVPKVMQDTQVGHSSEALQWRQASLAAMQTRRGLWEIERIALQNDLTVAETRNVIQEYFNVVLRGGEIQAVTANQNANAQLRRLEIPHAENAAQFQKDFQFWNSTISPMLHDVTSIINSAAQAVRAGASAGAMERSGGSTARRR